MEKLLDILNSFNGRSARNEDELIDEFRKIANAVINGGYFLVNGNARIYRLLKSHVRRGDIAM